MYTVLIADDHPIVRAGLREFLADESEIRAVGEASSGRETLQKLRKARWDLLVLDINLQDRSSMDVLRQVRDAHPKTRVLIMSGFPERQYAVSAMRAGAFGYLPKKSSPEELLRAVRSVIAGRRYVSAGLADLLAPDFGANADEPLHAVLSQRELQVLRKLASGITASQIGIELRISVKTVSTYRSRLLHKMHLRTNADLTTYALRNGLLSV